MAQELIKNVSLQLVYVSGDDTLKRKTFNNIQDNAEAADLLAVAKEIATLQTFPLQEVNTSQTKRLEE